MMLKFVKIVFGIALVQTLMPEAISALERVKQVLKKFWKGVADFLHIHYKISSLV